MRGASYKVAPPSSSLNLAGGAEGGESETLPHSPWAQKALAWEAALLSSFPLLGTSSLFGGGGGGEVHEAGRKAGRPAICNVVSAGRWGVRSLPFSGGAGGWLGSLNTLHAIEASPRGGVTLNSVKRVGRR